MYKIAILHVKELIKHPSVWLYLVPSILIALIYYFVGDLFGIFSLDGSTAEANPSWWDTITNEIGNAVYLVYSETYKFFILTVLSPVMGLLSEKIEQILNGKTFEFNLIRLLKDLLRAVAIFTSAFFLSIFLSLLLYLVTYLFGLQFIVPYFMFVFTSFFIGFSFFDYSLERYRYNIARSWKFAFQNKLMMIVSGIIFSLLCYIPIVGIIIAPFTSTLFSTSLWVEKVKSAP